MCLLSFLIVTVPLLTCRLRRKVRWKYRLSLEDPADVKQSFCCSLGDFCAGAFCEVPVGCARPHRHSSLHSVQIRAVSFRCMASC